MEAYVKNNLIDITYQSELILDIKDVKDLIRAYNLRRPPLVDFRKLRTH